MECSGTSIKRRGASLVELLVAVGIGSIVILALANFLFFTGRSYAALANYVDLDFNSRNALDHMTKRIRGADELVGYSSNKLVFTVSKTNNLSYVYSPTDQTLTEYYNSESKVLLKGCEVLSFDIFQRNTAVGTYDQFPATLTNNAAKLVRVSWICERTARGGNRNTESVQSAKIVIRNQ